MHGTWLAEQSDEQRTKGQKEYRGEIEDGGETIGDVRFYASQQKNEGMS